MRRFLAFFKRTPSAIKPPESVEVIVKQGNETFTIKDVQLIIKN